MSVSSDKTGSMDLRPGQNVRIVTDVNLDKERITVKASVVHDVNGRTIVLAQTDPPILKSTVGRDVMITYLAEKEGAPERRGFPGRIVEIFDYGLSSGNAVKALKVEVAGEPRPYNVRMFYRVAPTNRSGVSIHIRGVRVNILDLSLGGARVTHDKSLRLEQDAIVAASLEMSGKTYPVNWRVVRAWDGASEGFGRDLLFAALEFVALEHTTEYALSQKIRDIEREAAGPYL